MAGAFGAAVTIKNARRMFIQGPNSALEKSRKAVGRKFARFGMFVQRDAKQSMRKRSSKRGRIVGGGGRAKDGRFLPAIRTNASQPGQPPTPQSNNANMGQNELLKRLVFFLWDKSRRSVVIGPALLDGPIRFKRVPETLEFGGPSTNQAGEPYVMKPRPYMRPAFGRQKKKHVPAILRNSIG